MGWRQPFWVQMGLLSCAWHFAQLAESKPDCPESIGWSEWSAWSACEQPCAIKDGHSSSKRSRSRQALGAWDDPSCESVPQKQDEICSIDQCQSETEPVLGVSKMTSALNKDGSTLASSEAICVDSTHIYVGTATHIIQLEKKSLNYVAGLSIAPYRAVSSLVQDEMYLYATASKTNKEHTMETVLMRIRKTAILTSLQMIDLYDPLPGALISINTRGSVKYRRRRLGAAPCSCDPNVDGRPCQTSAGQCKPMLLRDSMQYCPAGAVLCRPAPSSTESFSGNYGAVSRMVSDDQSRLYIAKSPSMHTGSPYKDGVVQIVDKTLMELLPEAFSIEAGTVKGMDVGPDGTLYFGTFSSPVQLIKIPASELTFAEGKNLAIQSWVLPPGDNKATALLDQSASLPNRRPELHENAYVFVALDTAPGVVVRRQGKEEKRLVLPKKYGTVGSLSSDWKYLFCGTTGSSPSYILKVHIASMTLVEELVLADNARSVLAMARDSQRLFLSTYSAPSTVVALSGVMSPSDCKVSEWAEWSDCQQAGKEDFLCGQGIRTSNRAIIAGPKWGGRSCPSKLRRSKTCYRANRPRDCCTGGQVWSTNDFKPKSLSGCVQDGVLTEHHNEHACRCPKEKPVMMAGVCVPLQQCASHPCHTMRCSFSYGLMKMHHNTYLRAQAKHELANRHECGLPKGASVDSTDCECICYQDLAEPVATSLTSPISSSAHKHHDIAIKSHPQSLLTGTTKLKGHG